MINSGQGDQSFESDSAYGDDESLLSDTTSIASTILRHRWENGRRYHKFREGEYWGPNDDVQNDQLDIAHHMFGIMLKKKLHLAPIGTAPTRMLQTCSTAIFQIQSNTNKAT
jgi:hypothetical protein